LSQTQLLLLLFKDSLKDSYSLLLFTRLVVLLLKHSYSYCLDLKRLLFFRNAVFPVYKTSLVVVVVVQKKVVAVAKNSVVRVVV